jgi:ABC-2 type transport system ATP-binding protein
VIEVDELSKSYGETLAVDGLSFTVEGGEVLGLIGPNGAGKTTTLRSLAGIIHPTAGRIRLAGHDLADDPVAAKRRLAFIPDEPHLFEHLTAGEHLQFVARLYGVEDAEARSAALLDELELAEHREKLPDQLSRGMKQKLMVACALLHGPRALILDEPLTGLDPAGMRRMKRTILAQAAGGAAVLLSSHLLQLVEELCDRILVIRAGRAVFLGGLSEISRARPDLEGLGLEEVFLALTGPQAESAR